MITTADAPHVVTLCCPLNLAENAGMWPLLKGERNLVAVNSCAIAREAVRHTQQPLCRTRSSHVAAARPRVAGCAAEPKRAALAAIIEMDGFIANADKRNPPAWNAASAQAAVRTEHTRASVAIRNDGEYVRTLCATTQGREPGQSIPIVFLIRKVKARLLDNTRTIVLAGVDLASKGWHRSGNPNLGELAAAVLLRYPFLVRFPNGPKSEMPTRHSPMKMFEGLPG